MWYEKDGKKTGRFKGIKIILGAKLLSPRASKLKGFTV